MTVTPYRLSPHAHRRQTNGEPTSGSCLLLPTSYLLLPTSYLLPPTPYLLPPTSYLLPPTPYSLLPTPYSLLPTSLLRTSYFLPPTCRLDLLPDHYGLGALVSTELTMGHVAASRRPHPRGRKQESVGSREWVGSRESVGSREWLHTCMHAYVHTCMHACMQVAISTDHNLRRLISSDDPNGPTEHGEGTRVWACVYGHACMGMLV